MLTAVLTWNNSGLVSGLNPRTSKLLMATRDIPGRLGIPRVIIGGPTGLSGMAEGYVKTGGGEARINGIRMCPGMA
jgi:hypothetical protein